MAGGVHQKAGIALLEAGTTKLLLDHGAFPSNVGMLELKGKELQLIVLDSADKDKLVLQQEQEQELEGRSGCSTYCVLYEIF